MRTVYHVYINDGNAWESKHKHFNEHDKRRRNAKHNMKSKYMSVDANVQTVMKLYRSIDTMLDQRPCTAALCLLGQS